MKLTSSGSVVVLVARMSEKVFGTAYKNSIIDTVILLTKKKIYKNRQKG